MAGPLTGTTIVELAGLGPAPFAGMMLADNGARVIRVERPGAKPDRTDILARSREARTIDLQCESGVAELIELAREADGLIEGFRPGVLERLGIGPDILLAANPRLVIGRMTGWGQDGPYSGMAGHDLNYIALAGALHLNRRRGEKLPAIPGNLIGDFGGGGMLLAFGMVAALLHAQKTGTGQVVDCAMVDGVAALMAMIMGFRAKGSWNEQHGSNTLDSGAHFYNVYETADGGLITVAAAEPQFYRLLRELTGTDRDRAFDDQWNRANWPQLTSRLADIFRQRTRSEWCALMDGTDSCFSPVLSPSELLDHPHIAARGTYFEQDGIVQPAPTPRYSVTANDPPRSRNKHHA